MENEFENMDKPLEDQPQAEQTAPEQESESQPIPQFQPSSEYRWVRPDAPKRIPKQEKPRKAKKGKKILKLTAVCLICALLGGIVGAGSTLAIHGVVNFLAKESGLSTIFQGNRPSTKIEIQQIDTGKLMTPAEVYALRVNSTVGITTSVTTTNFWGYKTTSAASGSGFIYSADGYILTNYHVVEDSTSITVSLYDGRSLKAALVGFDAANDVAVLKVEAEDLTPVVVGDSANLNVGDPVLAIGNPLGELTFSLTYGAVSALAREITFSGGSTMSLIQTDCAINSGNSGGALFNLYGEVIGITNAKYSGNSGSGVSIDNIGFAIPMNRVRSIVDSIIEKGYVVKPYVGVTIIDVSAETQSYGLPNGAAIRSVEQGGTAEKAGLQPNDIVTHINGEKVQSASEFKQTITDSTPGDVLQLTVWRKGATIELSLTVGEKIQNAVEQSSSQQSGQNPSFGWSN